MPKVVGGLAALVALSAGILSHVDPLDCLWRAALAFLLGLVATQVWYVFFAIRTRSAATGPEEPASLTDDGAQG